MTNLQQFSIGEGLKVTWFTLEDGNTKQKQTHKTTNRQQLLNNNQTNRNKRLRALCFVYFKLQFNQRTVKKAKEA